MSLAVAASRADGQSTLTYPNAYRISYPRFLEAMRGIGVPMSISNAPVNGQSHKPKLAAPAPRPERATQYTLDELVAQRAREAPLELAVVEARDGRDATLTWRELAERVDRTAMLLLRLGVRSGERVAFQLPNTLDFVVITLAVLRVGAICCPLMPIFREREVAFCLRRSRARVLFVPDEARGRRHAAEVASLLSESSVADGDLPLRLEHVVVCSGSPKAHPLPTFDRTNVPVQWLRFADALREIEVDTAALDSRRPDPTAHRAAPLHLGNVGRTKRRAPSQRRLDARCRHGGRASRARSRRSHLRAVAVGPSDRFFIWDVAGVRHGRSADNSVDLERAARAARAQRLGRYLRAGRNAVLVRHRGRGRSGRAPPPAALRIFVGTGAAVPRGLAERATRILGTAVCGGWGTTES